MLCTLFRTCSVVLCLSLLAATPLSAGLFSKSCKADKNCQDDCKCRKSYKCRKVPRECQQGVCYPSIDASLYPCPRPDVPREIGWTLITNQALAPHEMLYPHTYQALYPPYYYHNKGCLTCIPFFPKPKLRGTEVTVKYKTSFGLFSNFNPPVIPK